MYIHSIHIYILCMGICPHLPSILEVGASRAHAHCHGKALHHLVLKFDLGELGEIC